MDQDERDRITALVQDRLRAAVRAAERSANPVLAELARELAAGRLTTREALANPAYRELLEERLGRVMAYQEAPPEERDTLADDPDFRPAPPAGPGRPVVDDDDYFEQARYYFRGQPGR